MRDFALTSPPAPEPAACSHRSTGGTVVRLDCGCSTCAAELLVGTGRSVAQLLDDREAVRRSKGWL